MIKRKSLRKITFGVILTMVMIMAMCMVSYAEEDVSVTINSSCEAQVFVGRIKQTGITANYTVICNGQSIIDYIQKELDKIPVPRRYRAIEYKSSVSSNGVGSDCSNTTNACSNTTDCSNATTDCSNTTTEVTPCNKNNDCSKDDCKTSTETGQCKEDKDATSDVDGTPKTGDESHIKIAICLAIFAGVGLTTVIAIKKKRD